MSSSTDDDADATGLAEALAALGGGGEPDRPADPGASGSPGWRPIAGVDDALPAPPRR